MRFRGPCRFVNERNARQNRENAGMLLHPAPLALGEGAFGVGGR